MSEDNNTIQNSEEYEEEEQSQSVSSEIIEKLRKKVDYWRSKLLDLSKRNRLISFKDYKTSNLSLLGENLLEDIFNYLLDGKSIKFFKIPEEEEDTSQNESEDKLPLESDEGQKEEEFVIDDELIESLISERVVVPDYDNKESDKRLYNLYLSSKESLREKGINTLFISLGFLKYFEAHQSDEEVLAPLILVPLTIKRVKNVGKDRHPYSISFSGEDIHLNPAIFQKLVTEFSIELPEFDEELGIQDWFENASKVIKGKPRWDLIKESSVGILSFQKLHMYLDLEKYKNKIFENPILRVLVGDEQKLLGSFEGIPEENELDDLVPPENTNQVLESDSSQRVAIEAAKNGTSFIIQGPPGTGKSQTIVNMIAELLSQGKRILFVSEKMAALEVVKKRLDSAGIGRYCLELHSNKSSKKGVLNQLEKSLESVIDPHISDDEDAIFADLKLTKEELNKLGKHLFEKKGKVNKTIYEVRGELARFENMPEINFEVEDALLISVEEYNKRLSLLGQLENYEDEINNYYKHPWKNFRLSQLGYQEAKDIKNSLPALEKKAGDFNGLIQKAQKVTGLLFTSVGDVFSFYDFLNLIEERPGRVKIKFDWVKFKLNKLSKVSDELKLLVENKNENKQLIKLFKKKYKSQFFDYPIAETLEKLNEKYGTAVRFLKPGFWKFRTKLKGLSKQKTSFKKVITDLRRLEKLNKEKPQLEKLENELRGKLRVDNETDLEELSELLLWLLKVKKTQVILTEKLVKELNKKDLKNLNDLLKEFNQVYINFSKEFNEFVYKYFGKKERVFGKKIDEVDIAKVFGWIKELNESFPKLRRWIEFDNKLEELQNPLNDYVVSFLEERIESNFLVELYKKKFCEGFLSEAETVVTQKTGDFYRDLVDKFRALDPKQKIIAKKKIVQMLEDKKPKMGAFKSSGSSELQILKREISKQRSHMALRNLFARAPNLIFSLKPCFMMSPLSVTQYINLDKVKPFDVVIFDEASQVMPEDAVSCLIRANQAIIAGDSQQLPPTMFFYKTDEEEVEESLEELESILDEFSAVLPNREKYLKWHYRSKDEELITFSNRKFYKNRLITFPNSGQEMKRTGIEFVYVEDGIYDRGGTRKNIKEAQKIVNLLENHIKNCPKKSLGVVAFSRAQQMAILEQIEVFRNNNPQYEDFFIDDALTEFFVKNLETVQGDERDVIIFSVGYGFDEAGKISTHFGPINKTGGYKRLNVAITRAREKIYLVASFKPENIDLTRTSTYGVHILINYMKYARDGEKVLIEDRDVSSTLDFDSSFEEAVYERLAGRGFDVVTQVGASGYKIDLAIKHPKEKGKFILGIECDGSAYHSSKTARDRDRIRQSVLESLGWHIHRIWSSDWLANSSYEVEKIEDKVEALLFHSEDQKINSVEDITEYDEVEKENSREIEFADYNVTKLNKKSGIDAFNNSYSGVRNDILRIVKEESPIHLDLLTSRLIHAWNVARAGSSVRRKIMSDIRLLEKEGVYMRGDVVWWGKPQDVDVMRLSKKSVRPFELIPLAELAYLVIKVLENGFSIGEDDLKLEIAKQLGYRRRGKKMQRHLDKLIDYLMDKEITEKENGRLKLKKN